MKNTCLLIFALALLILGCGKEDLSIDPKKDILGKWEVVEPVSYPGSYEEYLRDSVLYIYNSENDFFYSTYWFNDSLLYKKDIYIDGITNDTILIDIRKYKYDFIDYNTLRLDIQRPALIPRHIYKRIN